jgi:large-conductance mechanosensitive channel
VSYPNNPQWQQPYSAPRETNGMAIAALVGALLLPPLGIIFGHIARGQIKRTGEGGKGMATWGLVLGYIGTIVIPLIIIAAIVLVVVTTPTTDSGQTSTSTTVTATP